MDPQTEQIQSGDFILQSFKHFARMFKAHLQNLSSNFDSKID